MSMSSISFASPSMRGAGSDLTVSVSPLGLVELADEEFEVHGPRLNRYATNWAFYLGQHWGYRREAGEPQITFNYVKALSDFITNFTFSRGVHFTTPKMYQHIVPALLKRVWEVDNDKASLLWDIGNQGGVSGDSFVKVAYDPAWVDPSGMLHPGRVRILPLNSSYCFPEWHPHDRGRLLRFKMKYKFWGTSTEGTRQVYTYTEILTEDVIEEYINDDLIDSRPNPLGVIPIEHICNVPVSGSPWGLADISDILSLNREYNEKATDISDIINYHAAPVTIITGAKASNLEKGPKKVWGGLPKDASVFNLENGVDLAGPMAYLEMIKRTMHEMTGVPESALGQMQPISNTSGVALSIMYQPMMQRYNLKKIQYGLGFRRLNRLVLKTLWTYEPETLAYDPSTDGILTDPESQPLLIDPNDPAAYDVDSEWPPPLPVDALVVLNELVMKFQLGLISKRGALVALGTEFPDEMLQEIFEERIEDAKQAGALAMVSAKIQAAVVATTGIVPDGEGGGQPMPPAPQSGESSGASTAGAPSPVTPDVETQQMITELVTQAYGTKSPQRRNPDNPSD